MSVQGDDILAELKAKHVPVISGPNPLEDHRRHTNSTPQPLLPIQNTNEPRCGLCGNYHGDQPCAMTESSENLAQYRLMLLVHAGDEPLEDRVRGSAYCNFTLSFTSSSIARRYTSYRRDPTQAGNDAPHIWPADALGRASSEGGQAFAEEV